MTDDTFLYRPTCRLAPRVVSFLFIISLSLTASSCKAQPSVAAETDDQPATDRPETTNNREEADVTEQTETDPLESHAWDARPVVIFAPSRDDSSYQRQLEIFEEHEEGLRERDIVLYHVFDEGPVLGPDDSRSSDWEQPLRERFQPESPLTVILVGKDTTEKLRQDNELTADKLFETIDAMPMRQREMEQE